MKDDRQKIDAELEQAIKAVCELGMKMERDIYEAATPAERVAIAELKSVTRNLEEETDRGCVLVGASYLDERLEQLLRAKLIDGSRKKNPIFDATGPLGSFSGKIEIAWSVGLLSTAAYRDLKIIKTIRNEFAHSSRPLKLSEPQNHSRCRQLQLPNLKIFKLNARYLFTSCVGAIAGEINSTLRGLAPFAPPVSIFVRMREKLREYKEIMGLDPDAPLDKLGQPDKKSE